MDREDEDHFIYFGRKYGPGVANAMRALLRVPGAVLLGAGEAAGDAVTDVVDAAKARRHVKKGPRK